ncbi:MAG TPA: hypothetical protein VFQ35_25665 [Polyangiaceae bacterium]|nr:hypothetical protein [Polyangiaceae bacterium]
MRRDRIARLSWGLWVGVALYTSSCSGPPDDLFAPRGGAGGAIAKGGTAGTSGSGESGSVTGGVGGEGGFDDGFGGAPSSGGAPFIEGGRVGSGGVTLGTGGTSGKGGSGGTSAGAANGGKAGMGNLPNEIVLQINRNSDDCTWILVNGAYQERLRFSEANPWLEVGSDTEQGRIGLRFALPIPPKATIVAASLQLTRVDGNAAATNTLTVQVFDTGDVPAFDASHTHGPRDHGTAGLYGTAVRGTMVGEKGKTITTGDLKVLVQRVVDRADFVQDSGTIGFVIFPDTVRDWAAYGDSSNGMGASLRVSYRVP